MRPRTARRRRCSSLIFTGNLGKPRSEMRPHGLVVCRFQPGKLQPEAFERLFFNAANLWRKQEGQPMRSRRGSCPELPRKKNLLAGLFVVLLLFLLLLLHLSFFLLFLCCFFFLGVVLRRVLRVGRAGNTQERCERQST